MQADDIREMSRTITEGIILHGNPILARLYVEVLAAFAKTGIAIGTEQLKSQN